MNKRNDSWDNLSEAPLSVENLSKFLKLSDTSVTHFSGSVVQVGEEDLLNLVLELIFIQDSLDSNVADELESCHLDSPLRIFRKCSKCILERSGHHFITNNSGEFDQTLGHVESNLRIVILQ